MQSVNVLKARNRALCLCQTSSNRWQLHSKTKNVFSLLLERGNNNNNNNKQTTTTTTTSKQFGNK